MKKTILALILVAMGVPSWALLLSHFRTYDSLVDDSTDIIIARCMTTEDSLQPKPLILLNTVNSDIDVVTVLKGSSKPGLSHLASLYRPYRGQLVLIFGSQEPIGTNSYFAANEEYRVIPLNRYFPLAKLSGKSLNDQLKFILESRLYDVSREISYDNLEKARLEHWFAPNTTPWPDNPTNDPVMPRSGGHEF